MGWLYTHRPRGLTDREWFASRWGDAFNARVVDVATVERRVFHAVLSVDGTAMPELVPEQDGKVRSCLVYLIKWLPKQHHNFGYKDMDETMGPTEAVCPESILDQLSPIDENRLTAARMMLERDPHKHFPIVAMHRWREECRRLIDVRKALRPGARFTVDAFRHGPLRFSDGVVATELTCVAGSGRSLGWIRQDGVPVTLSRAQHAHLMPASVARPCSGREAA